MLIVTTETFCRTLVKSSLNHKNGSSVPFKMNSSCEAETVTRAISLTIPKISLSALKHLN